MSEMPGPDVDVNARAPDQFAPSTMPIAASSSSACTMQKLFLPVSGSLRCTAQNPRKASMSDVDGVMGYQAATVAPAYTHPSARAVLPSIMIESLVASIVLRWNGSGQGKLRCAYSYPSWMALWLSAIMDFFEPYFSSSSVSMTFMSMSSSAASAPA